MKYKYCFYTIPLPLLEIWNRTLTFWQEHRGKVMDQQISDNNIYRTLEIHHKPTATSFGEVYQITFGFNPKDSMTYVSVEISLIWGDGLQWRKAKSLMKKWAHIMGVPPMKLVKSLDKKYSELLTDLSNISTPQ